MTSRLEHCSVRLSSKKTLLSMWYYREQNACVACILNGATSCELFLQRSRLYLMEGQVEADRSPGCSLWSARLKLIKVQAVACGRPG